MEFDADLRSIQEARQLAQQGEKAALALEGYSEEKIDKIIRNMVAVGERHALELAKMAVLETGFGIVEDKVYKNHLATGMLYESIKDMKTQGILSENKVNKTVELASPVGLIMGIVPSTNPTSTTLYKSIIAIKARNPIVFSPHPSAKLCTLRTAELMNDAVQAAGGPANCVSCLKTLGMGGTNELMHSKCVKLIIATGGPGMVKAAYSAGKPAIGVGAGNSPAFIEKTANVAKAVERIMVSKTFDNGTVCASEQSVICERCNESDVIAEFERQGGYFMTEAETEAVTKILFKNGHSMNSVFVAKKPQVIAKAAGFKIGDDVKVLLGRQGGVGPEWPLSYEKLTTVLAFYTVENWQEACDLSIELLQNGIGHTMSIHTEDPEIAMKFTAKPASRILVNTGGTMGGTGASTGLAPAMTLGCGTMGGSSVSDNVTPMHLINKKVLAYGTVEVADLLTSDPIYQKYHGAAKKDCAGDGTQQLSSEEIDYIVDKIVAALK